MSNETAHLGQPTESALNATDPSMRLGQDLRLPVEEELSEHHAKAAALCMANVDTERLARELQIRQVELEKQNDELTRVQAELRAALRQYTDLYDSAPVGYFTLAHDGRIHQTNLAGASLLGVERNELTDLSFGAFVSASSRATFNALLENVFGRQQKGACEVRLVKSGGDSYWAYIEALCNIAPGQPAVCQAVVSDITARKAAEEELRHLSTHDELTGLYNRGFFAEALARLERGREFPVSIIMADVDHLKDTNDREGHAAGDVLLKRVAQALIEAFRAEDVIARIGGDEFAVLLPATDALAADVSLRRVRQIFQDLNLIQSGVPIYLSLGVSTAEKPSPLLRVLQEADANMYHEKHGRAAARKTQGQESIERGRIAPPGGNDMSYGENALQLS